MQLHFLLSWRTKKNIALDVKFSLEIQNMMIITKKKRKHKS